MNIATSVRNGVSVVRPEAKRLEAAVAAEFKELMRGYIAENPGSFVMDLSGVDFVDSSGLAALLHCVKQLEGKGSMVLGGVTGNMRELFSITRLDQNVFTICPTLDQAVETVEKTA